MCSEDSGLPAHSFSLIRILVVSMMKLCILGYPKCTQQRLWSDCANMQADLNLHQEHMFSGTVSEIPSQITLTWKYLPPFPFEITLKRKNLLDEFTLSKFFPLRVALFLKRFKSFWKVSNTSANVVSICKMEAKSYPFTLMKRNLLSFKFCIHQLNVCVKS